MVSMSAAGVLPVNIDLGVVWATLVYIVFGGKEPYEDLHGGNLDSDYHYYYVHHQQLHPYHTDEGDDEDSGEFGYRSLDWRQDYVQNNNNDDDNNDTKPAKVSNK